MESANLASATSTNEQERGTALEDLVAEILKTHLPARATVTTHRQIIGVDSKESCKNADGKCPSGSIDVIVYNEWTTMPTLLDQGYVLAESVYLGLEIKGRREVTDLNTAIRSGINQHLPYTKITKKFIDGITSKPFIQLSLL